MIISEIEQIQLTTLPVQAANESVGVQFSAQRIGKTGQIILQAPVETVYPLFGAIREKDWTYGWDPEILFSQSGDMELHMIFRTRSPLQDEYFVWTVTQYRPDEYLVEYLVTAHERCWFVTVSCEPFGNKTKATVAYQYTGFTVGGHTRNELALEKMFALGLRDWEEAINYYLATGKQLH